MNLKIGAAAYGLGLVLLMACGGQTPPAESPGAQPAAGGDTAAATAAPEAKDAFGTQVAEGQKLYAANCASCHGDSGEGGKGPRVVGVSQGALPLDPPSSSKFRKEKFKTAADIAGFVVKTMPPNETGKLTEEQYWAILAFDLKANGVTLDHRLDAASAPSVVIHP